MIWEREREFFFDFFTFQIIKYNFGNIQNDDRNNFLWLIVQNVFQRLEEFRILFNSVLSFDIGPGHG